MHTAYSNSIKVDEERAHQEALLRVTHKEIKILQNFRHDFLENINLLNEKRGTAVVNEFKELPKELAQFTSSTDPNPVKWYQYRLRTKLYLDGDEYGVDGIQAYAIKVLAKGNLDKVVYQVYYDDLNTVPNTNHSEGWKRASNCEIKIDKDNELRILAKDSMAAKSENYELLVLDLSKNTSLESKMKKLEL